VPRTTRRAIDGRRHLIVRRLIASACIATTLGLATAAPALAHADHTQGHLSIAVGFATEPAYAGQPNAVQLLVTHDAAPVTDLAAGDLQVEIGFGGQTTLVDAVPEFEVGEWGTPGDYRAPFIPSEPGPYTFHVTGSVDGESVDFSMTSGPKTFDEVQDPAPAMFPAVQAPSNADLSAKLDQISARADAATTTATDAATQARAVAVVAVIVAVAALAVAIASRRRRAEAPTA
jgi:hypothetical protein